jgi:hypothetical protein
MGIKDTARGVMGGAVVARASGQKPGVARATAGAAIAGGITSVVVFRLLRSGENEN